jgi:hypothetical protein
MTKNTGMTLDDLLDAIKERFPYAGILRKDYEQLASKFEGSALKMGWVQLMATWKMGFPPPPSQLILACRRAIRAGEATIERREAPPQNDRDGAPQVNWKRIFEEARPLAKRLVAEWWEWNQDVHAPLTEGARYHLLRIVRGKGELVAQRRAMAPGSNAMIEVTAQDVMLAIDRDASQTAAWARMDAAEGRRRSGPGPKPLYVQVNDVLGRPSPPPPAPEPQGAPAAAPVGPEPEWWR